MRYIDANVFVYAAVDAGRHGVACRDALRQAVAAGAGTAALTVDEVLWATKRLQGREQAEAVGRNLLAMPVKVWPVDRRDVEGAIAHFAGGLDPRDAIHATVARRHGCEVFLTTDGDFKGIEGLSVKRIA